MFSAPRFVCRVHLINLLFDVQMISIIIPTLQEEKAIPGTLRALKDKLSLPHEIIVSDGGSSDRTVELARPLADQVLVYRGVTRQTISQGRNDGAKVARGEFLLFLDADCVMPQPDDFLARALSHFQADTNLVALTGNVRVFPDAATRHDRIVFGVMNFAARVQNNVFGGAGCVGGEFQMVRKTAFDAVGGYREDLVTLEDRDLFFRLSKNGRTYFDPALTIFHTGRRAHIEGWPRLIIRALLNIFLFQTMGRVRTTEWRPIR
jgi:glycosyltransferase involved in cell wall biosynthesis